MSEALRAMRIPTERDYVEAARDIGFTEAQWKAMFYDSGPYDVTTPTFQLMRFVSLMRERFWRRRSE